MMSVPTEHSKRDSLALGLTSWAQRGRLFEAAEKAEWVDIDSGIGSFEHRIELGAGEFGRADIFIDESGWVSIIEVKATDWDAMQAHRVRPNARRHVRQVMRYVGSYWEKGTDISPGLVYPRAPQDVQRRQLIERVAEESSIQVVWADERPAPAELAR